jgi:hypothetical protein
MSYTSSILESEIEDEATYNVLGTGDSKRRTKRMLRIVRHDGDYCSIYYDAIIRMEGMADGTRLALLIRGGVVKLEGKNLVRLATYLEEQRVAKLYAFKEGMQPPRDEAEPVITSVITDMGEDFPVA